MRQDRSVGWLRHIVGRNRTAVTWCAIAGLVVAGVEVHSLRRDAAAVPGPGARRFPNVVLETHTGKTIHFYDDIMRGDKIVMINFMYAKCNGICPGATRNLLAVQRRLAGRIGKDIFMYSITLSPESDSPAVLAQYAKSNNIGPGWTFLTGSKGNVELLRRALGFTDPDPALDRDRSNHSGMVLVGNEALDRYMSCAALENPDRIVESVLWMESPTMGREQQRIATAGGF